MKNKVWIAGILACLMSTTSMAGTIPRININGYKACMVDSPFIEDGRVYIPLRNVSETLGGEVSWDAATQTATIRRGETTITQKIGERTATVNGKTVTMDGEAKIVDARTYVPVRFVSETLGGTVKWDDAERIVKISIAQDPNYEYDAFGKIKRTDNLPYNVAEYEYIVAGTPNAVYELPLHYEDSVVTWSYEPIDGEHYTSPRNFKKYRAIYSHQAMLMWLDTIETNLNLRLNVDYRTIDEEWVEALLGTYEPLEYKRYRPEIEAYAAYVKENKIVIEGDYYVEPSTTYDCVDMKAWVKLKVSAMDGIEEPQVFSMLEWAGFENGAWYEGPVQLGIGTRNGWSDGSDLYFQITDRIATKEQYYPYTAIQKVE